MSGSRLLGPAMAMLGLGLLMAPATSEGLPALPAGWPTTLQLGLADGPGGAAQLKAGMGVSLRYQYLAGGVNTGSGWSTWNSDGSFVTMYVQESVQQGITPVFSYYMLLMSSPGNAQGEPAGIFTNLETTATMRAYYEDLKLFFQRAGAFPGSRVVLHVEPDLWGYMHLQRAMGDDAASVPVQVAATGLPELAGLPDNAAGFAQAIANLRDRYAPNVLLAYQLSVWGTAFSVAQSNPSDATVDAHAGRAAAFFTSLGGRFDLVFGEFSDRDAGYYQYVVGDGGASWWDAADFARFARYLGTFVASAGKRVVLWQIPLGNTRMRAVNNTWHHYQDNRVEWFLDDPSRAHLTEYVQAGVVAFLFGRGADGNTCACDASGDGMTNPAPINGNTGESVSADDDGGFFRERSVAYYAAGAMPLEGGSPAPPPPGPAPTTFSAQTAGPPNFTVTGTTASPDPVAPGAGTTIGTSVTNTGGAAAGILVDMEVYDASGTKIHQQFATGQSFQSGQQRTFQWTWPVPAGQPSGVYTVKIGTFSGDWGTLYTWQDNAGTVSVQSGGSAAQTAGPPNFTVTGTTASPDPVAPGAGTTIGTSVTNTGGAAAGILVDMEIYDASGTKIHQQFATGQSFQSDQQRTFQWTWPVPAGQPSGVYTVKIGIFSGDWGTLYTWQDNAGTVSVESGGSAAQTAGPPSFTVTGTAASPNPVSRGTSTTITTSVTDTGEAASGILVDMEVYDAGGAKIHQQVTTGQSFLAGQQRTFQWTWPVPATQASGVYTVKFGIFSSDWATLYTWNNAAAFVTVP